MIYLSLLLMVIFSFLLLFSGDLIVFWSLLEIIALCVVPCFYVGGVLGGLLSYLVASSMSSVLILVGLVFPELYLLFGFGLYVKFGLFPFVGWVYNVLVGSGSWLISWVLSILMKVSMLYLVYFFWGSTLCLSIFLSVVGLFVLGVNFWVGSLSWLYVWCHMMLSSSIILFVLGLIIGFDLYFFLLLVYFVWGTGVIRYLSVGTIGIVGYIMWLLAVPLSFSLYYKIYTCYLLCGCLLLLFFWFLYSFLEQFYLVKWLVSSKVPKFCYDIVV